MILQNPYVHLTEPYAEWQAVRSPTTFLFNFLFLRQMQMLVYSTSCFSLPFHYTQLLALVYSIKLDTSFVCTFHIVFLFEIHQISFVCCFPFFRTELVSSLANLHHPRANMTSTGGAVAPSTFTHHHLLQAAPH